MSSKSGSRILGGIGHAFSDRNFRVYSIGAIATWIGFYLQLVAVSWYTWELTHSTAWLAIIALLDIVSNILLMPFAGAVADRFDKYWIMGIVSLLTLIQAMALALLAWAGVLTIWPLAILVLIHGIIISFMVPAMYGILPRFVERSCLTSAIAVSSSYAQLAVFLGPALAGWIVSAYGVVFAFGINAFGYFIYLISWRFLRTPENYSKPTKSTNTVFADIKDGFTYILKHRGITSILVIILAADALGASVFYMTPAFSDEILEMGVVGVSIILSSKGLGAVVAAFWIAYWGEQVATAQRILWGFLLFTFSVYAIFVVENIYFSVIAFFIMGLAAETYSTITTSLIQLSVSEEQRGRVMGTLFMFSRIASGIGTYLIGYYAVSYGLKVPMLVAATVCLTVWLVYFMNRKEFVASFIER